ncbi:probable G-protein coupled receptor 139 [Microcaecilia unicolor]|uniref:Probable G-protein coupled receptor 139 n=1 Tax=Microcaecilia unicolor TaxID=1415580 RepID=A0A6P7ZDM3_9AMPH|nr:probable G-protein coupled receptor 139 [Microcaecilia unicolor]
MGELSAFEDLMKVYYTALGLIGIPANLFAAYVVLKKPCALSKTTTIYLVALAISDTTCLLWACFFNLTRLFQPSGNLWLYKPWCDLAMVLEHGTILCSTWIIVAFTIERYVVLFCKHNKQILAQPKVAVAAIIGVLLLSYLAPVVVFLLDTNMHWIESLHREPSGDAFNLWRERCFFSNSTYLSTVAWIHPFIYGGLPFFLIILFSSLIAHQLQWKMRVQADQVSHTFRVTRAKARKSVGLLLTVSFTTVCLGLPRFVVECIPYNTAEPDNVPTPSVVADVTVMLEWLNSGLDFCLYCLACSAFRKECASLLRCRGFPLQPARVTIVKLVPLHHHSIPVTVDATRPEADFP